VNIQSILTIFGVAFLPTTITLASLWLTARRRAQKAEGIIHDLTVAPALRGERAGLGTEQLGQALDAIAVEVERISEGQRFTTKLLSEQRDRIAAPSTTPRVNTPH
jgi:hypothetical protein